MQLKKVLAFAISIGLAGFGIVLLAAFLSTQGAAAQNDPVTQPCNVAQAPN
jgi:hypothetical protein